ncbi:hypothetical protein PUN28_006348 [Cardiocondyla obscurior]|uniref:Uncharacterized protein n=1 Tax=Cardiocondyla obscurior TaxID=286306 RepID=A0AAW2GA10_9HYME
MLLRFFRPPAFEISHFLDRLILFPREFTQRRHIHLCKNVKYINPRVEEKICDVYNILFYFIIFLWG